MKGEFPETSVTPESRRCSVALVGPFEPYLYFPLSALGALLAEATQ